jgi:hypothetical protein
MKYKEAYRKGDYILNHYCRNSYKDKLCLSRSLHRWAIEYAKRVAQRASDDRSDEITFLESLLPGLKNNFISLREFVILESKINERIELLRAKQRG